MLAICAVHCLTKASNARVDLLGMALGKSCGKALLGRRSDSLSFVTDKLPGDLVWSPGRARSSNKKVTLHLFRKNIPLEQYVFEYSRYYWLLGLLLWAGDFAITGIESVFAVGMSFVFENESQLAWVLLVRIGMWPSIYFALLLLGWNLLRVWVLHVWCAMLACSSYTFDLKLFRVERLGGEIYSLHLVWLVGLIGLVGQESALAFVLVLLSQQRVEFRQQFANLSHIEYASAVTLTWNRMANYSRCAFGCFCEQDYFYLIFALATKRYLRVRNSPPSPASQTDILPKKLLRKRSLQHVEQLSHISGLFKDIQFPPSNYWVFEDWDSDAEALVNEDEEFVYWLRPQEIRIPALEVIDGLQIKQGQVADCWLLSALCVVAIHRELINQVLPPLFVEGKAVVNLFNLILGEWEPIEVDDRLPCDVETRLPMFAWSQTGAIFPLLGNKLAVLISKDQASPRLSPNHAYSVIEVAHNHNVRLYDPHGSNDGDGTFWLSPIDLLQHFKWACTCQVFSPSEYHQVKAIGKLGDRFDLRVRKDNSNVVVYISLTCTCTIVPPGFSLLLVKGQYRRPLGKLSTHQVLASTPQYSDSRVVSLHLKLPRSATTFTLLPTALRSAQGTFRITLYHSFTHDLEILPFFDKEI
ncbi:hypothetical protein BASA81_003520 [Batrachochytrium salamandrivorans]|nr:hypothetical protein BASA81_003520 [Batrachochytrium salamandrivorans]